MPISTSSFGDERDDRYTEYQSANEYERETLTYPGITASQAETYLKRLGGGVEEKLRRVEGIGWVAEIVATGNGVDIVFAAHEELLDDLIRRFEEWIARDAH